MISPIIVTKGKIHKIFGVKCPCCKAEHVLEAKDFNYDKNYKLIGSEILCRMCSLRFFVVRPDKDF